MAGAWLSSVDHRLLSSGGALSAYAFVGAVSYVVRGDAWPTMLSPCDTSTLAHARVLGTCMTFT